MAAKDTGKQEDEYTPPKVKESRGETLKQGAIFLRDSVSVLWTGMIKPYWAEEITPEIKKFFQGFVENVKGDINSMVKFLKNPSKDTEKTKNLSVQPQKQRQIQQKQTVHQVSGADKEKATQLINQLRESNNPGQGIKKTGKVIKKETSLRNK